MFSSDSSDNQRARRFSPPASPRKPAPRANRTEAEPPSQVTTQNNIPLATLYPIGVPKENGLAEYVCVFEKIQRSMFTKLLLTVLTY